MEKVFSMDSFWLIFWGIIASASAWAFWHYTGEHGFQIITGAVLISLIVDNRRMRKQTKNMNNKVMDQKMLINMIKRTIKAAKKLSDGPHKDAMAGALDAILDEAQKPCATPSDTVLH